MNKIRFLVLCLMSWKVMALTTIYDGADSIPYHNEVNLILHQQPQTHNTKNPPQMPGLPAKSNLKAGVFDSYQLPHCQPYPVSYFVVGIDELSIDWLKTHSTHLKTTHALGFVTNIGSQKELSQMNALSPIQLVPTNIDHLAGVLKAPAYPFFTNGCEVWQ